eukprot:8910779-Pyramimonas_sp.AAC.1
MLAPRFPGHIDAELGPPRLFLLNTAVLRPLASRLPRSSLFSKSRPPASKNSLVDPSTLLTPAT